MSVRCACVSVSGLRLIAGGAATPTRPRCSRFVHGLFYCGALVEQKVNEARTLPLLLRKLDHTVT